MERELLLDYALGALTEAEERRVAEHLKNHPEDAAYVRDLFESLAEVAMDQEPAALPADGERALLERVRAQGSVGGARRRRQAWWPALAAAAVLAVIVVTRFIVPDFAGRVDAMLQQTCAETGVVCEPLMSEQGDPMGMIAKRPDARLLLVMDSQPPQGGAFQAWQIMAGEPTSLGVFEGRAMEVTGPLAPGAMLGITIEPSGGSTQPTMPPVALMQL